MYSILPATVAVLFLVFGLYVVQAKGFNRVTGAFFVLCVTTFFWQFDWAILFQIQDEKFAQMLIKLGWLLILFLPTSLFHFLVEITGRQDLKNTVIISYFIASILAAVHVTTDLVIDGHYTYYWGFYPKAGMFHSLHVLQTTIVVLYALYICYQKQKIVQAGEKVKLQICGLALMLYSLSAVDYLCNYGIEFYPPGVIFNVISLGIISIATVKYQAMEDSRMMAASLAHEMRTPLATLNIQSQVLREHLPELIQGYRAAVNFGHIVPTISELTLNNLVDSTRILEKEVKSANHAIDMLMALSTADYLNEKDFHHFSMKECIEVAISRAPCSSQLKEIITLDIHSDFIVLASKEFLIFVFINLINNSIDALKDVPNGKIKITVAADTMGHRVEFLDDGTGIDSEVLPYIFDRFFTTKHRGTNSGVGLAFCKNVMESFGGSIACISERGKYTRFLLTFKD